MSSKSSNEVNIFVGILAGVAVVLVLGVVGLVGAGFLMFRAQTRAIPVPSVTVSGPTVPTVASETMETSNVVLESPVDDPVVAPIPKTIGGDEPEADDTADDEPVIAPVPAGAD